MTAATTCQCLPIKLESFPDDILGQIMQHLQENSLESVCMLLTGSRRISRYLQQCGHKMSTNHRMLLKSTADLNLLRRDGVIPSLFIRTILEDTEAEEQSIHLRATKSLLQWSFRNSNIEMLYYIYACCELSEMSLLTDVLSIENISTKAAASTYQKLLKYASVEFVAIFVSLTGIIVRSHTLQPFVLAMMQRNRIDIVSRDPRFKAIFIDTDFSGLFAEMLPFMSVEMFDYIYRANEQVSPYYFCTVTGAAFNDSDYSFSSYQPMIRLMFEGNIAIIKHMLLTNFCTVAFVMNVFEYLLDAISIEVFPADENMIGSIKFGKILCYLIDDVVPRSNSGSVQLNLEQIRRLCHSVLHPVGLARIISFISKDMVYAAFDSECASYFLSIITSRSDGHMDVERKVAYEQILELAVLGRNLILNQRDIVNAFLQLFSPTISLTYYKLLLLLDPKLVPTHFCSILLLHLETPYSMFAPSATWRQFLTDQAPDGSESTLRPYNVEFSFINALTFMTGVHRAIRPQFADVFVSYLKTPMAAIVTKSLLSNFINDNDVEMTYWLLNVPPTALTPLSAEDLFSPLVIAGVSIGESYDAIAVLCNYIPRAVILNNALTLTEKVIAMSTNFNSLKFLIDFLNIDCSSVAVFDMVQARCKPGFWHYSSFAMNSIWYLLNKYPHLVQSTPVEDVVRYLRSILKSIVIGSTSEIPAEVPIKELFQQYARHEQRDLVYLSIFRVYCELCSKIATYNDTSSLQLASMRNINVVSILSSVEQNYGDSIITLLYNDFTLVAGRMIGDTVPLRQWSSNSAPNPAAVQLRSGITTMMNLVPK